jgi:hypothetical protein
MPYTYITHRFIDGSSTVNLCALDLSKAFDKVNHSALFIKLMKRRIPTQLLDLLTYYTDWEIVTLALNGMTFCPRYLNSTLALDKALYCRLSYTQFTLMI